MSEVKPFKRCRKCKHFAEYHLEFLQENIPKPRCTKVLPNDERCSCKKWDPEEVNLI
ncbi:MAG: hypothetical protein OEL69_07105 [Nitrosopumilus sp.]|nr:hypothetical protein [Nitrosopumilus sp.]